MFRYDTNEKIAHLVERFESAAVTRDEWKHAEHLVVALAYVEHFGMEEAIERMRSGILNLLTAGFGVDLEKEMPYHETITVFWIRTVTAYSLMMSHLPITERAEEIVRRFDKDFPLRFYSRERLFSDEARARFIGPDLDPPPFILDEAFAPINDLNGPDAGIGGQMLLYPFPENAN